MIYAGHRDSSMLNILKRYIPVAATFGGICVGILTIIADLMGAIGSGFHILYISYIKELEFCQLCLLFTGISKLLKKKKNKEIWTYFDIEINL